MPDQKKASGPVTLYRREDGIAVVLIDNPPVNATSAAVRQGLQRAIGKVAEDSAVRGVVLACKGRTFVAGADISEFGKPPVEPHLPDLCLLIEQSDKPWVAALHGTALGGGLELALACRGRVAAPDTRLGLPEVTLGLIPGAGGTVRLPRLIGAEAALDMIAGGKPVPAKRALELGLVDELAGDDLLATAAALALRLAEDRPDARKAAAVGNPSAFAEQKRKIADRARGQNAPLAAIEAVENAVKMSVEDALAAERALFTKLKADPQSAALRYVFFAERSATKMPRLRDVAPRPVTHIGVVGGGTMGAGIAAAVLLAGLPVTMIERDGKSLDTGLGRVKEILSDSHKRGLIDADRLAALVGDLEGATDYAALSRADLVVEAVFEEMEIKREVFASLDAATRPDAVLATNTSYLDVGEIAESVADPSRVLGLHFFSPAHVMKLLEVIHPPKVADDVLATGFALGKRLKKLTVPAGVCDGFIGNRIMSAYRRDCEAMLLEGALPRQIDAAMRDYGFPMGIFQMQDLAGLDIAWAMRKRRAATGKDAGYVDIADRLCEAGRFGRKTGRGWYDYRDDPKGAPDPEVEELVQDASKRAGVRRRDFDGAEIIDRILRAMTAEGEKVLSEGIAASPEAIDVVMINGYGFPRYRGGPMFAMRG